MLKASDRLAVHKASNQLVLDDLDAFTSDECRIMAVAKNIDRRYRTALKDLRDPGTNVPLWDTPNEAFAYLAKLAKTKNIQAILLECVSDVGSQKALLLPPSLLFQLRQLNSHIIETHCKLDGVV